MDFREICDKVFQNAQDYGKKYHVLIDQDFALLKLYEEVGEYAQMVLVHRKKSRPEKHLAETESKKLLAHELADIIGMVIVNAALFDIDLEQALKDKWLEKRTENK